MPDQTGSNITRTFVAWDIGFEYGAFDTNSQTVVDILSLAILATFPYTLYVIARLLDSDYLRLSETVAPAPPFAGRREPGPKEPRLSRRAGERPPNLAPDIDSRHHPEAIIEHMYERRAGITTLTLTPRDQHGWRS